MDGEGQVQELVKSFKQVSGIGRAVQKEMLEKQKMKETQER